MTKRERTGIRSLDFSQWVRDRLPDSRTGFSASDLDFMLWNWKTQKVLLLETKTRNAEMSKGQRMQFERLAKWVEQGIDADWDFAGFHVVKFENTNFDDGEVYLDGEKVTEEELQAKLSNFEP